MMIIVGLRKINVVCLNWSEKIFIYMSWLQNTLHHIAKTTKVFVARWDLHLYVCVSNDLACRLSLTLFKAGLKWNERNTFRLCSNIMIVQKFLNIIGIGSIPACQKLFHA